MKTLIWNGSPRENGDTASLLKAFREFLPGEVMELRAYSGDVGPCVDCRYCWENSGCCIKDGWIEADKALRSCDSVVIASPIYFSELSGPLLSVLSRLQQYYCAGAFRGEKPPFPPKRGGLILVGGGDGSPRRAAETGETLLRQMGCREVLSPVICHNTNNAPALSEPGIRERLRELADFFTK